MRMEWGPKHITAGRSNQLFYLLQQSLVHKLYPQTDANWYLDSQLSSWFAFSVYGRDTSQPWQTYRHGNITWLATFSIARLRMLPNITFQYIMVVHISTWCTFWCQYRPVTNPKHSEIWISLAVISNTYSKLLQISLLNKHLARIFTSMSVCHKSNDRSTSNSVLWEYFKLLKLYMSNVSQYKCNGNNINPNPNSTIPK